VAKTYKALKKAGKFPFSSDSAGDDAEAVVTPHAELTRHIIDPVQQLKSAIRQNTDTAGAPPKVILFTSAVSQEGTTTVVYNLGNAMAMQGEKVAVVDANLYHPVLHHFFNLDAEKGITDAMEAGGEYRELARSELKEPVHASPAMVDGRIFMRGVTNLYCLGVEGLGAVAQP